VWPGLLGRWFSEHHPFARCRVNSIRPQILATYLVQKGTDFVSGRNTIELGSGTGLVGLLAGILGGKVWITDQSFVPRFSSPCPS